MAVRPLLRKKEEDVQKLQPEAVRRSREIISFGPFRLYPSQRLLEREGETVKLGGRAFDILLVLVENAGEVVSQKQLIEEVWHGVFVEDVALRVHIASLRKVLDSGETDASYLGTIPGRGYSFVVPTTRIWADPGEERSSTHSLGSPVLPPMPAFVVGRDSAIDSISEAIAAERLVSIVGPGGIGKTTVVVAVTRALLDEFRGAIYFVDLGLLSNPVLLHGSVASAFGIPVQTRDPLPALIAFLRSRGPTLLVLDSSEHLISEVAALSERLLAELPNLRILVTSREELRAAGEHVVRLPPLESPPDEEGLTAEQILAFPAAQLFLQRVASSGNSIVPTDTDGVLIGAICRKLGGIALAIELAAGRIGAFSLKETAELLDSQFALRWPGRRTAPPRHQTLSATLDWSYGLLSTTERTVLRRLSVFVGEFTLDAARQVTHDDTISEEEVTVAIAGLVAKSLASVSRSAVAVRYRLLDTTRTYSALKLAEAGEYRLFRRRHALYYRELLEMASAMSESRAADMPVGGRDIDDVRAALTWAFGPEGERSAAVDLAAYSLPIWLNQTLFIECRDWLTKAVALFADGERKSTPQRVMIWTALASISIFTIGISDDVRTTWNTTLESAERLQDAPRQVNAYLALWAMEERAPLYADALDRALRCSEAVKEMADAGATAMADWMLGVTKHHLGRLDEAQSHLQRSLETDTDISRLTQLRISGYDRRVDAIVEMANVLWLQGYPDQATTWSDRALDEAKTLDSALTLSAAMTWAGINRYLSDPDTDAIERDIVELAEHARTHSLGAYQGFASCILGLCQARSGQFDAARPLVARGLRLLSDANYGVFHTIVRSHFCEAAIRAGHLAEAQAIMSDLEDGDRNPEHWCKPEVLRVKGLLASSGGDNVGAERQFSAAMRLAHDQNAQSWKLKCATDLGDLLLKQGRRGEAREVLRPVYERFTEGFDTIDLRRARQVLEEIGSG